MTKENIKETLRLTADKYGYKIKSEERLDALADKFKKQKEAYGEMYCPCQTNRNEDTICPCRYMRKYSACRCGLYEEDKGNG